MFRSMAGLPRFAAANLTPTQGKDLSCWFWGRNQPLLEGSWWFYDDFMVILWTFQWNVHEVPFSGFLMSKRICNGDLMVICCCFFKWSFNDNRMDDHLDELWHTMTTLWRHWSDGTWLRGIIPKMARNDWRFNDNNNGQFGIVHNKYVLMGITNISDDDN